VTILNQETQPRVQDDRISPSIPHELANASWWSDTLVRAAGIEIIDTPLVTIGGGIGSFVLVDYLRIAGVPTEDIRVLSNISKPWQTYEHLTRVSQIPRPERIRSDSSSRPDNIWGFPSYAVEESIRRKTLRPLLQVAVEPVLDDYYTPRVGDVLDSIKREATRIGYWKMLVQGQAEVVRRRHNGGYFSLLRLPAAEGGGLVAYRSKYVHLAVGYPGLRFLPELQEFRTKNDEYVRVVNAYEDHEHVYSAAKSTPCTILIRGSGIVASRVLQRLMDDRKKYQLQTEIVHLFRNYIDSSHGPHMWMRRPGADGFAYQGFNYPKSVWGGQLKARVRRLEGDDRARAYGEMGGTSTASRRGWRSQQSGGRREGWYKTLTGVVEEMRLSEDGKVVSSVATDGSVTQVAADFVIDCTGLNADITESTLLSDLLRHSGAARNIPTGRLDVARDFEVIGTASGDGKLYASGAMTLGGYFPGVDTFLGLQISAQEIVDSLACEDFCHWIGPCRSFAQWMKWLLGKPV
jgi:hypothetical protein